MASDWCPLEPPARLVEGTIQSVENNATKKKKDVRYHLKVFGVLRKQS